MADILLSKTPKNKNEHSSTYIGKYMLTTQFVASGNARWAFATRDNRSFFIKEHISPVYKTEADGFSPAIVAKYEKICSRYYSEKKKLYDAVKASADGNIVYISDFFRFGNKFYSVTERVEGVSPTPKMIQDMKPEQKLILLKVMANSLCQLHSHRVIHGDIKPSNILLKNTGYTYTLKLIDFDASYFNASPPKKLQFDEVYASPETILYANEEDVELTTKSDVFSMGLMFHFFYTGTLPQLPAGVNYPNEAVIKGHILRCRSGIPASVARIIESMLQLEPEDRPDMHMVFQRLGQNNNMQKGFYTPMLGRKR